MLREFGASRGVSVRLRRRSPVISVQLEPAPTPQHLLAQAMVLAKEAEA
jgi:hypothetical protein